MTLEEQRLETHRQGLINWHKWGPYVSDRSWDCQGRL